MSKEFDDDTLSETWLVFASVLFGLGIVAALLFFALMFLIGNWIWSLI
jgi:nitrate reductase gamma subunit